MRRLGRSLWQLLARHGPETLGGLIAAAGVVIFQSPLGALIRLPLSVFREEFSRYGRKQRRNRAIASVATSAATLVDCALLTRGRPELRFWRPSWKVSVRSLAAEGFGGLPGFDETWTTLYAAVADDLAELHRSFSVLAFSEIGDLEETDRIIVKRILSALTSAIDRAMEISGTSAESGFRRDANAEDPLAARRESEPLMARHRHLYPLWREDLKTVVDAEGHLRELANAYQPKANGKPANTNRPTRP